MKKILYTFLIFSLFCVLVPSVNAEATSYYTNKLGINMTEQEYNNLLGLGFTEKQIYRMDNETFNNNKNIEATLISEKTTYYKTTTVIRNGIEREYTTEITKEEALREKERNAGTGSSIQSVYGDYYNGASATAIKAITSRISNVSNTKMRYKVDVEWLTMPGTKSYDIIGIGIEQNKVYVNLSVFFRQDWETTGGTFGYDTTGNPKVEISGGSALIHLPDVSLKQLESYLYFNVMKKTGVGTITTLSAAGCYSHATNTVTDDVYNYYNVTHGTGIFVDSPYAGSYDYMSPAVASFVGSW